MPTHQLRRRSVIARKLRGNSTDVERILWYALREKFPLEKFRRQHPIGNRVADFACPARKLVIELDGSQHASQLADDDRRTSELALHGYRVIRFWNNDVMENLGAVLETVYRELESPPPHPTLSAPVGRRGKEIRME
jgi:very-short-patch-repair endonuclease